MLKLVGFLSILFLLTVCLVALIRQYALKYLLDQPNQRSSHQLPTPRGGGLACVIVYLLATLYFYVEQHIGLAVLSLSLIGVAVAAIGFWDDHGSIPAGTRFFVHILAAFSAMLCIKGLPLIPAWWGSIDLAWFGYLLGTLMLAWMLNLFNFMDGIDGLAISEAIFVAFGLAAFMWRIDSNLALLGLVLGFTCLGFLVWNWPPAKIFMGDVGSGFLGFMLAVLIVLFSHSDPIMLVLGLILFAVFVTDASYTLLRRLFSGQQWYAAHRSHAYQKAAKQYGHLAVVKVLWLLNVMYLLPLALLAFVIPEYAWLFLILAYAPLLLFVDRMGAGVADEVLSSVSP